MSRPLRYKNPELQDLLAAEYALGSMSTRVRKRFERLMEEDSALETRVCQWEQHLHPLYGQLAPMQPGKRVWNNIDKQLRPKPDTTKLWNNLLFLRSFGGLAAAIIIGLSVLLQPFSPNTIEPDTIEPPISRGASYIAVMLDSNNTPAMVINTYRKPLELSVNLLDDVSVAADKKLYLWAITKETREVHALGALTAENYTTRSLSQSEWSFLKYSRELFITEEPLDFQAALPTGKIRYQGTCSVYKPKPIKN